MQRCCLKAWDAWVLCRFAVSRNHHSQFHRSPARVGVWQVARGMQRCMVFVKPPSLQTTALTHTHPRRCGCTLTAAGSYPHIAKLHPRHIALLLSSLRAWHTAGASPSSAKRAASSACRRSSSSSSFVFFFLATFGAMAFHKLSGCATKRGHCSWAYSRPKPPHSAGRALTLRAHVDIQTSMHKCVNLRSPLNSNWQMWTTFRCVNCLGDPRLWLRCVPCGSVTHTCTEESQRRLRQSREPFQGWHISIHPV